jgi:adenosine deaminase
MNTIKSISCLFGLLLCSQTQASVQSHFEQIKTDPNALFAFFKLMPKGGELHYHLAGGPYPEMMLDLAAKNNYCLNTSTFDISTTANCKGVNTKDLPNQPEIYAKAVRSWSLKDFTPGSETAHDHFFSTFFKFGSFVFEHRPELVADVIKRAANQNEQYLELMMLPDNAKSLGFGVLVKNTDSWAQKKAILLANKDFQANVDYTVTETERILNKARQDLGCDTNPQDKNCQVTIKFLYYSLREQPFDNFFAQTLNAFAAVAKSQSQNGNLVGVNLVQPEDGLISLHDYRKQMQVYQLMHQWYPQVNISLHAGELTQELVTPEDLNYHIHDALLTGQAQRIGHGVDIAHEEDAEGIVDYMAKQHKAVEINLISNQKLLNVSGKQHPLNYYLAHHVPVVLSTDDEGVLRTNLTEQYVDAVLNHGLDYSALKQINRNALTYAFVAGKSIWADADNAVLVQECKDLNSSSCKEFIKSNEKARLQWNLEQKLQDFEEKY